MSATIHKFFAHAVKVFDNKHVTDTPLLRQLLSSLDYGRASMYDGSPGYRYIPPNTRNKLP